MSAESLMIDPISHLVACSADMKWQALEVKLNQVGYTLGFFNPRCAGVTVRDLIMRNGPNLFYRQYGNPISWCVQLRSRGRKTLYETKRVPRTAAGPDFKKILLSSGRRYAELEEVTLRFHPIPERIDWHWSYWATSDEALSFMEELELRDVTASFAQSYAVESQPHALRQGNAVFVALRFSGLSGLVASKVDRAGTIMRRMGGDTVNISRRKIVPFLEKLMEGE